jgi:hypothetical protein
MKHKYCKMLMVTVLLIESAKPDTSLEALALGTTV